MTLDVDTLVGNRPLQVTGDGRQPRPRRRGPPGLRRRVAAGRRGPASRPCRPTSAAWSTRSSRPGRSRGTPSSTRLPPLTKGDDPRGRVKFDAWIDLNPGCSITWEGLKYPVRNLTGKLEIHPDLWIFQEMKGNNGQATITADGQVGAHPARTQTLQGRPQAPGQEPAVRPAAPRRPAQALAGDLGDAQPHRRQRHRRDHRRRPRPARRRPRARTGS